MANTCGCGSLGCVVCDRWAAASPKAETLAAVSDEVVRARTKFPGREKLFAALVEEVGELAQAMLQRKTPAEIRKECTQVAAVAFRLFEEGDSDFDGETWSNKA